MNRDISVVITFHNREQFIDDAIESVLAQTLKPLEIIIVNDGSRASSRRHLDRYAPSCTIVDQPVNKGCAEARNCGIRLARGEFLAFLDDDDIWLPNKLERQRRHMEEHPQCDAVHGLAWYFYLDREDELFRRDWAGALPLAKALRYEYTLMHPSILFRVAALRAVGGYDSRYRRMEDMDLSIRCIAAGYRIENIPVPVTRVRKQGQESLMKSRWLMFLAQAKLCLKHKRLYCEVYGARGVVSFLLESLVFATGKIRYLGGAVRRLIKIVPIQWRIRADYQEPITQEPPFNSAPVELAVSPRFLRASEKIPERKV